MRKWLPAVLALAMGAFAGTAHATIKTVFDDFTTGASKFDSTVVAAGGVPTSTSIQPFASASSVDFGAFSISRNNGGFVNDNGVYEVYGSSPVAYTSGDTVDIDPFGTVRGPDGDSIGSGITLTFASAVNAVGFEVGDWGTCCQPSALYMSFDNGAPIQVGISNTYGDVFLTNGGSGVFLAALDDAGSFNKVQFWGDGFGEYLVMGGTVHYALLDQGSLPPVSGAPEPGAWALMLLSVGMIGTILRRRRRGASRHEAVSAALPA